MYGEGIQWRKNESWSENNPERLKTGRWGEVQHSRGECMETAEARSERQGPSDLLTHSYDVRSCEKCVSSCADVLQPAVMSNATVQRRCVFSTHE